MKNMAMVCVMVLGLAVAVSGQAKKTAAADAKEILGRWVGSVTAEMGEMQFALDLKESDGKIIGTLETMHGDWSVNSATAKDGKWTIVATAEDGTSGKLVGQVKDGKLAGDWDFAPRAVGTFQLARPSTRQ